MFPIYVLEEGTKLPENGTYFIVAQDGIYLRKENRFISATVKVEKIARLQKMQKTAQLNLPRLGAEVLARSLLFFRQVYRQHRSEAEIQIHYNPKDGTYYLHCPWQQVSGDGVYYDSSKRFENHLLVGTIHSHADFSAWHSPTDHRDEKHFDGLHITLGHVNQPYFTFSAEAVVNNNRFPLQPSQVIHGIRKVEWKPKPKLTFQRPNIYRIQSLGQTKALPLLHFELPVIRRQSRDQFFDLVLPEGKDYRHVGFPRSWMDRVMTEYYAEEKTQTTVKAGGKI